MRALARWLPWVVCVVAGVYVAYIALSHINRDLEASGWRAERDVALRDRAAAHDSAARALVELHAALDTVSSRDSAIAAERARSIELGASVRRLECSARSAIDSARDAGVEVRDAFYERGIRQLMAALDSASARHVADSSAIAGLEIQVATLRAAAPRTLVAITMLGASGEQLAHVVRGAESKCRLARLLPCPTRTAAAIGGFVVGSLAVGAIAR